MTLKHIKSDMVRWPSFSVKPLNPKKKNVPVNLSDLATHKRAMDAIAFGLKLPAGEGNIFVVGADRSGRMDATRQFLASYSATKPRADDWVYLHNFRQPNSPKPYRLPAGSGRNFRDRMASLVLQIRELLPSLLTSKDYTREADALSAQAKTHYDKDLLQLKYLARVYRLEVEFGAEGTVDLVFVGDGKTDPSLFYQELSDQERDHIQEGLESLRPRAWRLAAKMQESRGIARKNILELRKTLAYEALSELFDALEKDYAQVPGLVRWLVTMRTDVMDNLDLFMTSDESLGHHGGQEALIPEERYAVNLLVDRSDDLGRPVIIVSNPTYESLFGAIKYRSTPSGYGTDFTLLRGGLVHKANGGILVLRAEDLIQREDVWQRLKSCLRDHMIRIDEPYRAGGIPVLEAPDPEPIPLDVKVIIVGAPYWFNAFYYNDPMFKTYFRVKAEIDIDMPATAANIASFGELVASYCSQKLHMECDTSAIQAALGLGSRIAEHRQKLTSRFEVLESLLTEAAIVAKEARSKKITEDHILQAFDQRLMRDRQYEERLLRSFHDNTTIMSTHGSVTGQVNGLTVMSIGQNSFGMPARITAVTYRGKSGIINIEKQTEMAGPLQQKGVHTLDGYLNSVFGQDFPVTFGCSLTFEQMYSEVDGDSATLAEVCCILSSLAETPLRQDLAMTGSMDQLGNIQVIGGVNEKIIGFYTVCAHKGLTGQPGVIIPKGNAQNLMLPKEICDAIENEKFFLYTVDTVKDAFELLSGEKFGSPHKKTTVLGKAAAKLQRWSESSGPE